MVIDRDELKKKAMKAASAEEVMEIVSACGEEITPVEAKDFFEKVQKQKADKALSLDELEAVSGGIFGEDWLTLVDWAKNGCCATVESGSFCWGTDMCSGVNVYYRNFDPCDADPKVPHNWAYVTQVDHTIKIPFTNEPLKVKYKECVRCGKKVPRE